MTDLMDLASRVEAGEGPDRDLDADIQDAVRLGGYKADRDGCSGRLCGTMTRMASNGDGVEWKPLPAFTASLDAALTLVPPGDDATGELYRLEAYFTNGVLVPTHVRASAWVPGAPRAYAATPAMALAAACLRARAHQGAAHADQ